MCSLSLLRKKKTDVAIDLGPVHMMTAMHIMELEPRGCGHDLLK